MPLPVSIERELLHIRHIDLRGYRRVDGLYDIEGRVTDTKEHPFRRPATDVDVAPGTPLHDMWIRLVVDEDLVIHDIVAVTDASPHAVCPEAAATLMQLKGARIGPGWTRFVKERLGGRHSCTHLMELLMPIATAAYQTLSPVRLAKPDELGPTGRPLKIDSCYAYAGDGQLVKKLWPQFHVKRKSHAGAAND